MNSPKANFPFARLLTLIPFFLIVACAEKESDFDKLWDSQFSGCGAVCHSSAADDGTENGPDLSSKDKFYNNLVNKTVNTDYPNWVKTGDCNDQKFITPGDANASTLAASLVSSVSDTLTASAQCNSSYNLHVTNNVSVSDPNGIINWINAGAEK